jgi:hypothetical protein
MSCIASIEDVTSRIDGGLIYNRRIHAGQMSKVFVRVGQVGLADSSSRLLRLVGRKNGRNRQKRKR